MITLNDDSLSINIDIMILNNYYTYNNIIVAIIIIMITANTNDDSNGHNDQHASSVIVVNTYDYISVILSNCQYESSIVVSDNVQHVLYH